MQTEQWLTLAVKVIVAFACILVLVFLAYGLVSEKAKVKAPSDPVQEVHDASLASLAA